MPLIFSKDNGILSYSLPIWQFYTDRNLALLFGTLFAIYFASRQNEAKHYYNKCITYKKQKNYEH
ncbi:hypothetical protein K140096H11_20380 [Bacteroides intestinalis]|uniref:Uncharacterized protein n=1 Tax=Bacteroides intestinalis TaxID=329854 RepID=A0A6N2VHI1_9BACE